MSLARRRGVMMARRAVGSFASQAQTLGATVCYVADHLQSGQIPDSSGHGRQPLIVVGPQSDTSDKPASFARSLLFDGVDDFAYVTSQTWQDVGGPSTFVFVSKHAPNGNQMRLFGRGLWWWGIEHDNFDRDRLYGYTANTSTTPSSGKTEFVAPVPSGWRQWSLRVNSLQQAAVDVDATQVASRPLQVTPGGGGVESLQIGHRYRFAQDVQDQFWQGRWAAFAMFGSELSGSQLAALYQTLAETGGEQPPPEDPPSSGNPTFVQAESHIAFGNSQTVPGLPSTLSGDLLVAIAVTNDSGTTGSGSTVTPQQSGWTLLGVRQNQGGVQRAHVFVRTADGPQPASGWNWSHTHWINTTVVAYRTATAGSLAWADTWATSIGTPAQSLTTGNVKLMFGYGAEAGPGGFSSVNIRKTTHYDGIAHVQVADSTSGTSRTYSGMTSSTNLIAGSVRLQGT